MYTSKDAGTASALTWVRTHLAALGDIGRYPEGRRSLLREIASVFHKLTRIVAGSELIVSILSFVVATTFHVAAFGWIEGIGLTLALFFHEAGHVLALWRRGYFVDRAWRIPVYFIPFVGAILRLWVRFRDGQAGVDDEAFVGIMGPIAGGVATFVAYLLWVIAPTTDLLSWTWFADEGMRRGILVVLGSSIVFNGFNLVLTVRPFDGGRVAQAISPFLRPLGFIALLLLSVYVPRPWIILPWMFALTDVRFGNEWRRAGLFTILATVMLFWSIAVDALSLQDIFNLGIAFLTAFGAIIYATGSGVPHYALSEWRAFRIAWKKFRGTYVPRQCEKEEGDTCKRLADRIRVPPDLIPVKEWDGKERRGEIVLDPKGKRRWLLFYLLTFGSLLLLGGWIFIELARFSQ